MLAVISVHTHDEKGKMTETGSEMDTAWTEK
jgi:hypothetical protein